MNTPAAKQVWIMLKRLRKEEREWVLDQIMTIYCFSCASLVDEDGECSNPECDSHDEDEDEDEDEEEGGAYEGDPEDDEDDEAAEEEAE